MVLAYMSISYSQEVLGQVMGTQLPLGTLRSNIKKLSTFSITITYKRGNLEDIEQYLNQNVPVIVFLDAGELPHWHKYDFTRRIVIQHAVVIVGLDGQTIHLMDPAFDSGPIPAPVGDFMLAWDEMDNYYATLTR
jgi:uncharacterized protein YvpB